MSTMEQERNMSDNVDSQQEESSSMSADESQPMQKANRQRKQRRGSRQPRQQQQKSSSGPLDSLPTGDVTQTAQGAAGGVTNTLGSVANGALQKQGGGDDGGKDTLRLRLDLNLEIEIQLKARIHGDLELALLTG